MNAKTRGLQNTHPAAVNPNTNTKSRDEVYPRSKLHRHRTLMNLFHLPTQLRTLFLPLSNGFAMQVPWIRWHMQLIKHQKKKLNQVNQNEQRSDGEKKKKSKAEDFLENGKITKPNRIKKKNPHTHKTSNKTKPQHTQQPRPKTWPEGKDEGNRSSVRHRDRGEEAECVKIKSKTHFSEENHRRLRTRRPLN